MLFSRRKVLEVIVKSREEAIEAELYGADRLELVRSLESGGLTPEIGTVEKVIKAVSIPVRVMIRERDAMSVANGEELVRLKETAKALSALPIDGLVLGFVAGKRIDTGNLGEILSAAPHCRVTFHRAFESLRSPARSIQLLKQFRQIDRILVRLDSSAGNWQTGDLAQWQKLAAPEIQLIVGLGLDRANISRIRNEASLNEIHVGRLLREPEETWGCLSRSKFLDLKSALE